MYNITQNYNKTYSLSHYLYHHEWYLRLWRSQTKNKYTFIITIITMVADLVILVYYNNHYYNFFHTQKLTFFHYTQLNHQPFVT